MGGYTHYTIETAGVPLRVSRRNAVSHTEEGFAIGREVRVGFEADSVRVLGRMKGFRFWGLVPAWALMLGTLILPVGIVILVSFAHRGAYGGFEWGFSLDSYREILFTEGWDDALAFDPKYLVIIGRTILFAALTTVICIGDRRPGRLRHREPAAAAEGAARLSRHPALLGLDDRARLRLADHPRQRRHPRRGSGACSAATAGCCSPRARRWSAWSTATSR